MSPNQGFSMFGLSRKQIILVLLVILLLVAGGWLYTRRIQRIDIATYVPESALGYLEINDWPQLLNQFTTTEAWQQLAPAYGIEDKLNYVGKIGWIARFIGSGETAILARSQFAVVITGIEVRGEEVRPRLALIAETHSSARDLSKVIEKRLPEFASKIYGRQSKETSEYANVTVTSYLSDNPQRRLLSAQIEGEWILANHPEPLRACIDTRLRRTISLANNFHLQTARPVVERGGELFGFVTGDGVTRLLRFGIFLLSSGALRDTGILETLQDVLSNLASRSSDGIAFGADFENGQFVDRYALLFKPDLVESLKPLIKVNQSEPRSLNLIPATIEDVTIINIENPNRTLDGIEAAVSARIGMGESFLLHQLLIVVRETLLGIKSGDNAQSAIGDEIANFDITGELKDRIWLLAVRNRESMSRLCERYLTRQGATLRRENYSGYEIISSSDARKGSAVFIENFLALGGRAQLIRLIEAQRKGEKFKATPRFKAAGSPRQQAAMIGFSAAKDEAGEMMASLARLTGGLANTQSGFAALEKLPFATSTTSLNEKGIYIESYSPFGNFPFFVSLVDGAMSNKSRRR